MNDWLSYAKAVYQTFDLLTTLLLYAVYYIHLIILILPPKAERSQTGNIYLSNIQIVMLPITVNQSSLSYRTSSSL